MATPDANSLTARTLLLSLRPMERTVKFSSDAVFTVLVLCGGVALRLIWWIDAKGSLAAFHFGGEATRAAISIANGQGLADVFFPGSGPSAHLMPLFPAIVAVPIWLFGIFHPATSLILLAFSLAQVGLAYLLLMRLFRKLDADPAALRWSLAFLSMVPVFVMREVADFRYWEGAVALAMTAASLSWVAAAEQRRSLLIGEIAGSSLLAALTFFLSPPVGVAVMGCWATFALRFLPLSKSLGFAATMVAALTLFIAPWAIRNQQQLGHPVLLRSNAGLELAIANHNQALSALPQAQILSDRLRAIHPFHGAAGRARVVESGGEIAYSNRLGAETLAWIGTNPGGFATLCLRHLRQFFFPEPWQFDMADPDRFHRARSWIVGMVDALGLAFLAVGLLQRRRGYWMLAVYFASVSLTYMLVQPIPRYTYLVYLPLLFIAFDGAYRSLKRRPE